MSVSQRKSLKLSFQIARFVDRVHVLSYQIDMIVFLSELVSQLFQTIPNAYTLLLQCTAQLKPMKVLRQSVLRVVQAYRGFSLNLPGHSLIRFKKRR